VKNMIRTGLAAALWVVSFAACAVGRLSALHSDIRVAAAGELTVTETLEFHIGARDAHRGVVREFAADYRDRLGVRSPVPLVLDKVMRNGRAEPYALERVAGGLRLRTGEAGRTLPRGKHVYQLVYRTAGQVAFFEEHDELYWNVGAGWGIAFERLSAEVSFERRVAAEAMKLDARTGAPDARGEDYHAFVRESSAAFRATRPLAARESMAVMVAFPKGVVAQPSPLARAAWYFSAHRGLPVGTGIGALMLALLLACRRRFARDPAPVRCAMPPEGVGPGGVRFIERGGYDERCLGAALLGLQSRGYLTVRERGARLRVERTGDEVQWFPGEQALAKRLLREHRHVDIRRHGRTIEETGAQFALELRRSFGARRWTAQGGFVLAAAGIGAAGVLAMLALDTPPVALAAVGALKALVFLLFATRLTPLFCDGGKKHLAAIEALRRYVAEAEPASEEEFARLAPYALALGLEKAWGKRFAALLPPAVVELMPPARDTALARPRHPLRHTRSAAA
jgi:hypothetical protein